MFRRSGGKERPDVGNSLLVTLWQSLQFLDHRSVNIHDSGRDYSAQTYPLQLVHRRLIRLPSTFEIGPVAVTIPRIHVARRLFHRIVRPQAHRSVLTRNVLGKEGCHVLVCQFRLRIRSIRLGRIIFLLRGFRRIIEEGPRAVQGRSHGVVAGASSFAGGKAVLITIGA